ncbi:hypothetical protein J7E88_07830 [Streptomyces sp. ISL-10]|uniref:hypothetical protein n=1 Tax=Streptomyces sp. ISL-10 TaxID=2819172 RepID=UPI001BE67D94|nr:hypothetical protein [Streptomyces sp. ISL-10]MBT2365231.1 hypothetical protein [Streptomyces sp. ISL-10]
MTQLPADQFHAGARRTAHTVLSERFENGGIRIVSTYCGGTGYRYARPIFQSTDPGHRRFVNLYCSDCDSAYRRANNGDVATSADDVL